MSSGDFVKGECRQCRGHLEFPANAAGQTITCPHCGQPTVLVPAILPPETGNSGRLWLGLGLAVGLAGAGLAAAFLHWKWAGHPSGTLANAPVAPTNRPAQAVPPGQQKILTNNFAILPFKLETITNTTLVYVTGAVQNSTDTQRFGVKIEFELFDTNDQAIGSASDYQALIEPRGEWHFKALVIQSKAVSARFNSITEQQ